jgi:hypothetical protein
METRPRADGQSGAPGTLLPVGRAPLREHAGRAEVSNETRPSRFREAQKGGSREPSGGKTREVPAAAYFC